MTQIVDLKRYIAPSCSMSVNTEIATGRTNMYIRMQSEWQWNYQITGSGIMDVGHELIT